jgi:hypothetical protein
MISPADQRIHNSIRLLKAETKDREARLQEQDRQNSTEGTKKCFPTDVPFG